jgi:hypothetical protein
MFVRKALEQIRAWWNAGADGHRPAPCPGLFAAGTAAPVGAVYISPAFTMDNISNLQRYVALHGDVLHVTKVSSAAPTVEPDPAKVPARSSCTRSTPTSGTTANPWRR